MEVTYFGLNAVRLRGREATVMIDPYEPKLGLSPVRLNVQIVIFTHEDPTHFSLQGLSGDPHSVSGAGEFEIKGVAMQGTQTFHDNKKGAERGKNFVYTIEIDDLRCVHLGHLGHPRYSAAVDPLRANSSARNPRRGGRGGAARDCCGPGSHRPSSHHLTQRCATSGICYAGRASATRRPPSWRPQKVAEPPPSTLS